MCLAKKWQHMMLTHAIEFNIFDNYHVIIFDVKNSLIDQLIGINPVSSQ